MAASQVLPRVQPFIQTCPAPRVCQHRARRHARRPICVPATSDAAVAVQTTADVEIENTSWTSRKVYARISVRAPVEVVWGCLSDYDNLGTFIPSLVENVCLERKPNGAVLKQVGGQEVAMGVKFSAACTVDCTEYKQGVPRELCDIAFLSVTNSDSEEIPSSQQETLFPYPRNSQPDAPSWDISFRQVEGDFQAFQGIWRMQPQQQPASTSDAEQGTLLCYAAFVQPKPWLPVRLIQGRIEKEVKRNLEAVCARAEMLHSKGAQAETAPQSLENAQL